MILKFAPFPTAPPKADEILRPQNRPVRMFSKNRFFKTAEILREYGGEFKFGNGFKIRRRVWIAEAAIEIS